MDDYFKPYEGIELQRRMVSDRIRTDAFAQAIREVVRPDDVVLDVGTGTGILAMLAARAGARQVYGIEQTEMAEVAADLVDANGLSDKVRILNGQAEDLQLQQKADVIISEWLGNAAFVERMLDTVIAARDNNLATSGRMLPSNVRLLLAPLDDPILYNGDGPGFWRNPINGLDFSSLQPLELAQGRVVQIRLETASVLAPSQSLVELDLIIADAEDAWVDGKLEFVAIRDAHLNGFGVWFEAELSENVTLDTGPYSPETHWMQTYMPFLPRPVQAGERFEVNFALARDPDPAEIRFITLTLGVGDHQQDYAIE